MKRAKLCLLVLLAFSAGIAVQIFWPLEWWRTLGMKALQRLRHGESPAILAEKKNVMVALTFGQSNAANSGETRHSAGPGVYSLFGGKIFPARDPIRGATGVGGSVWPRLGDRLMKDGKFDAIVFRCCAAHGSAIAQWAPGGGLHSRLLDAIRDCQDSGLKITHLLWHQGEADAETSPAEYARLFHAMLAAIRAQGVDAPIYVSVATASPRLVSTDALRRAQEALVQPQESIMPGPDSDLLGAEMRHDGVHFSTAGLGHLSELWFEALVPGVKTPTQPTQPPQN